MGQSGQIHFYDKYFHHTTYAALYATSCATSAHGHLSSSHLIYCDQYSDKYRSHNLVTNVQWAVSHRRGFMTTTTAINEFP
jgi:hypothetical protein